jgi:putative phosphoribosyl transferase
MSNSLERNVERALITIPADSVQIEGMLESPEDAIAVVLFAHGSGSSRLSPRNNYVAGLLREAGLGTLLMDLLTPQEDERYKARFDISLLSERLLAAIRWLQNDTRTKALRTGLFGASTGAAAALQTAARLGSAVGAVVSRGGRPDLAGAEALERVSAPSLLIVGGLDEVVIRLNEEAYRLLHSEKRLEIVPGATHLFEEPGTLESVASLARDWFLRFLDTKPA